MDCDKTEITSNKPDKNPARVAAGKKLEDYNKALKSNPPPPPPPPDNGGNEGEGNYYTTIIVLAGLVGLGYYMLSNSEEKGAVKKDVVKEDVVKGSKLRKFNN